MVFSGVLGIQLLESGFDLFRTTRLSEKYRRISHGQLLLMKVRCRCGRGESPRRHYPPLQPHSPPPSTGFLVWTAHSTSSRHSVRQVQCTDGSLLQIGDDQQCCAANNLGIVISDFDIDPVQASIQYVGAFRKPIFPNRPSGGEGEIVTCYRPMVDGERATFHLSSSLPSDQLLTRATRRGSRPGPTAALHARSPTTALGSSGTSGGGVNYRTS
jgi:hypothetical protein